MTAHMTHVEHTHAFPPARANGTPGTKTTTANGIVPTTSLHLENVSVLLQLTSFRQPWMPCLLAFVSIWWMGVAIAQPPDRRPTPHAPAAPPDDNIWHIAADDLGMQIRQLEQHLAWMRKWAAFRNDAETVEAVEAIQKKLVLAKDNHRELCRLCEKRLHDTPSAIACCQKIDDVMYEVIEDHLALMRRLHPHRLRHRK